jgi:hypothetical protein
MQQTQHKSFGEPDEVREFPNGQAEIVSIGDGEVGRMVFKPGWRWSNDVKPIAGTDSCEAPHFQYHVSGQLAIRMDDGTEMIAKPGDITSLPSGHDPGSWVTSPRSSSTGMARATTRRAADESRRPRRAGASPWTGHEQRD